jgi:hypothetical protein
VQKRLVLTIAASTLLLAFAGCHKDQEPAPGASPVGVESATDVDIDLPQDPNIKRVDHVQRNKKVIWKRKDTESDDFVICFAPQGPCKEGDKIQDKNGKATCKIDSSAAPGSYTYDVGPGHTCPTRFDKPNDPKVFSVTSCKGCGELDVN